MWIGIANYVILSAKQNFLNDPRTLFCPETLLVTAQIASGSWANIGF